MKNKGLKKNIKCTIVIGIFVCGFYCGKISNCITGNKDVKIVNVVTNTTKGDTRIEEKEAEIIDIEKQEEGTIVTAKVNNMDKEVYFYGDGYTKGEIVSINMIDDKIVSVEKNKR